MQPYTRHNEVPILDRRARNIEAEYFNRVQIALKQAEAPIRFKIPGLNHLDLILQQDAWIVVDRVLNDVPVAAWTDFQAKGRGALHEPVPCEVRIYHFAARMVLKPALEAIELYVKSSHSNEENDATSTIIPFKKET